MKPQRAEADRGLGKAADMDDALKPVEGGKSWGGDMFEIGEDIVLDDGQPRLLGQFQHPVRRHRGERCAGRVVNGRIGDVEPRFVLLQHVCELLDIGPVGCIGNTDNAGTVSAQQRMKIEIAGIVHQDCVSRFKQQPANQVECLRS